MFPYTAEFRRQMVELVRAGRSPEELAQEFEPTAQSIRNWVGQACDAGRNGAGLTTAEREELNQLRPRYDNFHGIERLVIPLSLSLRVSRGDSAGFSDSYIGHMSPRQE